MVLYLDFWNFFDYGLLLRSVIDHLNLFISPYSVNMKIDFIQIVTVCIILTITTATALSPFQKYQPLTSDCTSDCCRTLESRPPMTYIYYQKTGKFVGGTGQYKIDTHGYSGQGKGYLNPDEQCTPSVGPVPASTYKLSYCKNVMHEIAQRPCSFYLDPQRPEQICGRGDFFIHGCQCCTPGDDKEPPAAGCSAGCVIISYENRRKLRIGDSLIVRHYEEADQHIQSE